MPVALPVIGEGRVDTDCYHVLVLIARLDRRQQRCAVTRTCGIVRQCRLRTEHRLVIADVRYIESSCRVPVAVPLRREPLSCVPRIARVAVEVHDHVIGVRHRERRHRARHDRAAPVHHENSGQGEACRAQLAHERGSAGDAERNSPHSQHGEHREQYSIVLTEREQSQRIENVAYRREHGVRRRVKQYRSGSGAACFRVDDGPRADRRGADDQQNGDSERDRAF